MKYLIIISFLMFSVLSVGQISSQNYLSLFDHSTTAKYYKMRGASYIDYFLDEKVTINGQDYFARIRNYSWDKADTAYFREDAHNYYHYDLETKSESVVLPKEVEIGDMWYESDSSWSYEVVGIDEILETPEKNYENSLVVRSRQLTNKNKNKSKVYDMYYVKDLGMVGSMSNGELTSFLSEIKVRAKHGQSIGN